MAAYERIKTNIAEQIWSGHFQPGERLPSEGELARHYGVTRMTVRHALDQLVRDGLVQTRWGVGTFVSGGEPAFRTFNRLRSLSEEIAEGGRTLGTKILVQAEAAASKDIAEKLSLNEGVRVARLQRVRMLEGRPVALQDSWVPLSVCPSLAQVELIEGSLYKTLMAQGIVLGSAVQTVTAVSAKKDQSALLGVPKGAPLLQVDRLTSDSGGRLIELAWSWTVADLPIVMRLTRNEGVIV